MDISELYKIYQKFPHVQTDTRKLQKDDLFFALKGPNFNGNLFALKALEAGAAYAVIDEPPAVANERLIVVEDVLKTLQNLARFHRETFSIPFIAITGSNGKTTTKELVHAVLGTHYKTYFTQGNLNNHIGIPLTILNIKRDAEIAIIEMGASHQKEIAGYCQYAEPTHGIITNCGKAHLEGFGGVLGVRKGKGELYDYLREKKGTVFAFDDYEYLHEMSADINKIVWYGTHHGAVTGRTLTSDPYLTLEIQSGFSTPFQIATHLVGGYNLPNVLCAAAVGKHFYIPQEKIKAAIEAYIPSNSRSQLVKLGTNQVILDAYNANPSSMKAAIENFELFPAPNKVLVLGAMMELGAESRKEHEHILDLVASYPWEKVVLVGGDFGKIDHRGYLYFDNTTEASNWLQASHYENTTFLIKGSNSVHMEKVFDRISTKMTFSKP